MTEQLKISFGSIAMPVNTDCLPCIGIFGRKNAGKSSLLNIIAGAELAGVSKQPGFTLEPEKFSVSLKDIGHLILFDTSGIDDYGESGDKRILKTLDTLKVVDLAILVITGNLFAEPEKKLVAKFQEFSTPFIIIHNKSDLNELLPITQRQVETAYQTQILAFSCTNSPDVANLFSVLNNFIPLSAFESKSVLGDFVSKNDLIVLTATDKIIAADNQLTKPQIEITRDLLDNSCITLLVKQKELSKTLESIKIKPRLIILPTSQFKETAGCLPEDILMTTYGIIMSRNKGDFTRYFNDTPKLSSLTDGCKVLLLQAAADSTSAEYKEIEELRNIITGFTGKKLNFTVENIYNRTCLDLQQFHFAAICGSYLLTKKQVIGVLKPLIDLQIPVSTFDMVNAYTRGIFERATSMFKK